MAHRWGRTAEPWQMLYFDPAAVAGAISDLTEGSAGSAEFSCPALRDPASAACFLSLFRAVTDPHGGHSEIEGRENLLRLLSRLIERRDQKPPSAPTAIGQARERIDDDPSAPLSLGELGKGQWRQLGADELAALAR